MNENSRDSDTKPSDMFIEAMSEFGIASNKIECGWCGRIHLCPDSDYADEDYKTYCNEEYIKNPNKVILHYNTDGILGRYMNNILFVLYCPCNGLYRYEHFIWEHRNTIQNYLKVRFEQERQWDEQQITLNKLIGIS